MIVAEQYDNLGILDIEVALALEWETNNASTNLTRPKVAVYFKTGSAVIEQRIMAN